MDGIQLSTEPPWGGSLSFTTKSLGYPGTHLIDLLKAELTLETASDFEPRTSGLGIQHPTLTNGN